VSLTERRCPSRVIVRRIGGIGVTSAS
jgi:hypothetical protein